MPYKVARCSVCDRVVIYDKVYYQLIKRTIGPQWARRYKTIATYCKEHKPHDE